MARPRPGVVRVASSPCQDLSKHPEISRLVCVALSGSRNTVGGGLAVACIPPWGDRRVCEPRGVNGGGICGTLVPERFQPTPSGSGYAARRLPQGGVHFDSTASAGCKVVRPPFKGDRRDRLCGRAEGDARQPPASIAVTRSTASAPVRISMPTGPAAARSPTAFASVPSSTSAATAAPGQLVAA